jgi:membrane associated rhomboid family serine protease
MNPLIDSDQDSIALSRDHFRESLIFPVVAVCAMWAAHLLRLLLSIDAGDYGIISRSNYGLRGIVTAPLVHGSWGHLISNTFPMFVLSGLLFYFYQRVAYRAFWLIYFATGIAVWLFARPVSHVGASGVVYGLVSFIFWNGIFRQSLRSIILALLVLFFYSGMFMGILPDQEGISWESHLIGSLAGVLAAFWFQGELEAEELETPKFAPESDADKVLFLAPDTFEKTFAQRQQEAEAAARQAYEEWLRQQQNTDSTAEGGPTWQ